MISRMIKLFWQAVATLLVKMKKILILSLSRHTYQTIELCIFVRPIRSLNGCALMTYKLAGRIINLSIIFVPVYDSV